MKINFFNLLKPAFLAIPFLIFSCNDDGNPTDSEPNMAVVEDEFSINAAYEDTDLITLDVLQNSGLGLRTLGVADLCANTVVTHNEETKKITIDFGAGCTSPNGVTRKGKILLAYSGVNFLFPGTSIITSFEGYEINGMKIEGTRSLTNAGVDLINSRITLNVKIENGKLTWPDNSSATYISNQIRKLTLGNAGYQVDITGTSSGKSREGIDYTAVVTESLIVDEECARSGVYIPSSGVMDFTFSGVTLSANFGTGSCDKVALITYPGGSKEITLD
ncbi:MAG TPA: hypothetical protein VLA71_15320 [Algoriphagus sp.]|nr:hypothetical protein [Algoriphagus sp.]